jgi:hypothetical protein
MNSTSHSSWSAQIGLFVALVCIAAFASQGDRATAHLAPPASGAKENAPRDTSANAQANPSESVSAPAARSGGQQVMQEFWTPQQGAPEGSNCMAQTADGFLWIGGAEGLFRFDGERFERFHASSDNQLLSTDAYSLFAPTTGGLWVGFTFGGFSFVNNGQVKNYGGEVAASTGLSSVLQRTLMESCGPLRALGYGDSKSRYGCISESNGTFKLAVGLDWGLIEQAFSGY